MAIIPNLFNLQTTSANSTPLTLKDTPKLATNLIYTVHAYGTWGGATVKIQGSLDGVTYIDITNASYTSDTLDNLTINTCFLRAVLSGATGTTSLSVHLK